MEEWELDRLIRTRSWCEGEIAKAKTLGDHHRAEELELLSQEASELIEAVDPTVVRAAQLRFMTSLQKRAFKGVRH